MATQMVKSGTVVEWTNGTGSAVSSGDIVVHGVYGAGIATVDIANGAAGTVQIGGVHRLAKNTSDALTQGAPVWWDASAEECINAVAINAVFLGFAEAAAGASATTCDVRLAPASAEGPRTLTLAATGEQTLLAQDFLGGELNVFAPNTAAQTINLPSVAVIPAGSVLRVKKTNAAAQAVTLDPAGAETIAGGATYASIDANNDLATFISTGAAWNLFEATLA